MKTTLIFILFLCLISTILPAQEREVLRIYGNNIEVKIAAANDSTSIRIERSRDDIEHRVLAKANEMDAIYAQYVLIVYAQPTDIVKLEIKRYNRTELDVSANIALEELDCSHTSVTSLDLSKNKALKKLNCSANQLTELNVSECTQLTHLMCSSNQLTTLDVSNNAQLEVINCGGNQLTELNLSHNNLLAQVGCSSNKLSLLDVHNSQGLLTLNCSMNELASLDVHNSQGLSKLNCSMNELSSLDVSQNRMLQELNCSYNKIENLDVSKNQLITILDCNANQLTSLDLSANTMLTDLNCSNNKFLSLDLVNNKDLKHLYALCSLTNLTLNKDAKLQTYNYTLKDKSYIKEHSDYSSRSNFLSDFDPSDVEFGVAAEGGYTFVSSGHSMFYAGAEFAFSSGPKRPSSGYNTKQFSIGVGSYFGKFNHKSKALPVITLGYTKGAAILTDFRVGVTTHSVNPTVGLNLLNFAKAFVGYNYGFKKVNGANISGLTIGVRLSIGAGNYYVDWSN